MKVLFVCRANVVRSQIARAWYNLLTSSEDADAAGTIVDEPNQTLGERRLEHPGASFAVDVMHDKDIDISGSRRTQLTPEMLKDYDHVINMAAAEYTPEWLAQAPNYTFWNIADPMGHSYEITARARDEIEEKVKEFIKTGRP